MIATLKSRRIGTFFGRVERHDRAGFYGPRDPMLGSKLPNGQLLPPDKPRVSWAGIPNVALVFPTAYYSFIAKLRLSCELNS